MRHTRYLMLTVLAVLLSGSLALTSCQPEEDTGPDYSQYMDSTGLEITDSITVIFDGKRWTTLDFTANFVQEENSIYQWAYIKAHKPGSTYPAIFLKMYLAEGDHTCYMTFNDPGLGYIIPGALAGDPQGGALYYYNTREVTSPDGTKTSDWWPLMVKTSVKDYNSSTGELTAVVTATMFDYYSWVTRDVLSADSCETREVSVTFGGLSIHHH